MALLNLFSSNVEVQYKSYFLSKASLFTLLTTILNIILPFILAYRSRGFWLKSHYFYEKPQVRSTYDYLLIAETDDPSISIICGDVAALNLKVEGEEYCAEIQIQEHDYNGDGKNDILEINFHVNIPKERIITSATVILGIDYQIMSVCPLQMQSIIIINKEFVAPPNRLKYYGDLELYQTSHLPCLRNTFDLRYNSSIFQYFNNDNKNTVEFIIEQNSMREVTTTLKNVHTRTQNGNTGNLDLIILIRINESPVRYLPSFLQELKWAWPQYFSILIIFYWLLEKIRKFIFVNRIVMAWEIVPWKKN